MSRSAGRAGASHLTTALACLAAAALTIGVGADYAPPEIQNVPVERLIANFESHATKPQNAATLLNLARAHGMARVLPLTTFGLVLCGLSLIGVPGTAGFVSKWYLVLAALEQGAWWLEFVIVLSSLLAVVYVWRVVEVAYFRAPAAQ